MKITDKDVIAELMNGVQYIRSEDKTKGGKRRIFHTITLCRKRGTWGNIPIDYFLFHDVSSFTIGGQDGISRKQWIEPISAKDAKAWNERVFMSE